MEHSILPALIHIQTHLDGDLSLQAMASRAGVSPFHFHRKNSLKSGGSLITESAST